jgi:glucose-6-phosphate isomerase
MLSTSATYKALQQKAEGAGAAHLRDLMQDSERCASFTAEHDGIYLDYSRQNLDVETFDKLVDLAHEVGVPAKMEAMKTGVHINNTEDRAVGHVALRTPRGKEFVVDGKDVVGDVHAVLDKIEDFSNRVRSGEWKGASGKELTTVLAIGIGGSFLGPEFVFEALKTDVAASMSAKGRNCRFLANVDPVDVSRALEGLDPETTLCIVVSKTFTTAETMLNARTVKNWLETYRAANLSSVDASTMIRQHMVAVSTAIPKAVAFGIAEDNIFGFWDWVGGRFSVCSAVGMLPLAIQYGMPVMRTFLEGAHAMDTHFFNAPMKENLPVLLGLLGVWNSTFRGHASRAILPYAQALVRFAAHIQQLDMESNGKRVANDGTVLDYPCGEIIFGEPGTNGQHSFYQLIHQGRVIPAEFIGFCKSPQPISLDGEVVSNHDELMSNFFAQPDALAYGKTIEELKAAGVPVELHTHKEFEGNRPSLSLLFPELSPYTCGQLLALYEHRVAVQGFVWGINSFDQWGVELGKALAGGVRKQLNASRADTDAPVTGFNPSTAAMLARYLK